MNLKTCNQHLTWYSGLPDAAVKNICSGCRDMKVCTKEKKQVWQ